MSSPEPSATLSASAQAARVTIDEPNALPRVFGRYVLFDRIGRGGMADIFLARLDLALGGSRLCVLKQVLPALSHDPQFEQLLVAEAKLAARLTHGNVVQVLDLGREDDRLFIVMEYVEGFDLNQLLRALSREKRGLPLEFAVLIVREILRGLDYAHRLKDDEGHPLGLVHRDVSPSNVLISFEGEVKLCDFGIARAFSAQADVVGAPDAIPPQARIAGKSAYMAPEHARGEEIDARADVFAAGIVLWELCAGRRMYRGSDAEMLAQARAGSVPELPSKGLPDQHLLEQLLASALAPQREARFETAQAFLDALEDYAIGARLSASQLRLGTFLSENFGEQILDLRRQRELSVRALASSGPTSSTSQLPEDGASVERAAADARALGLHARRWREPGARMLPRSQERRLDSVQIPLAEHVPEALAEGDITEYELEHTLIGLDMLARETLAESVARREHERVASSALSGPSSAMPLPSTSLLLPSQLGPHSAGPYLTRELWWYALALGILLLGVFGYLLS